MATKNHPEQRDKRHATDEETRSSAGNNANQEERQLLAEHGDELSKTTQRAKWIHSPNEHEDRPGQTLATRSHDVIRGWAEQRHAEPATVPGTEHGTRAGVLRFNFPGYGGQSLRALDWDEWFQTFDDRNLVFLFQEHQKAGNESNFFHLDSTERERD